jgi:phosphoribosylformylglycinamidine synthase
MVEGIYYSLDNYFEALAPQPLKVVNVLTGGIGVLKQANRDLGLALSEAEVEYLYEGYAGIGRNPSDAELVMFGQVNSEHCRHKIFNAIFTLTGLDGSTEVNERSLFDMIRNTHSCSPDGVLVAYSDNSSCIEGREIDYFERIDGRYEFRRDQIDIIMKVETHNHPTAIAPFAGAATGVGGEIRDEGSTGIGSRSKAGLSAFVVSHLRIPGADEPWEGKPRIFERLASPLQIMIDGPIGGASFGNEFGRPQLCGVFRTFELDHGGRCWGYHKPIMVAGGVGSMKREHIGKRELPVGAAVIQLGGPSLRIGVGGGAASSLFTGQNREDLDFDSVQRSNPEMQRRCQEVIDACCALGKTNPILAIHDVGAGGLSNACPELVEKVGATFNLRSVHCDDSSLSPMEIWCNESQERYVLAVERDQLEGFLGICERERCPAAVIGHVTGNRHLKVEDPYFSSSPVDVPMEVLLGKPPKVSILAREEEAGLQGEQPRISLSEAAHRVMRHPTVARKDFLITIADRSVTGLVARDQMVGPYQVPVSDVAATVAGYQDVCGEAFAIGERTPISIVNSRAAARMAVGEALTNILAAPVTKVGDIKLSANWMAACGEPGEDARLWQAVESVGMDLCPKLGIAIPVGKDSLSMKASWRDNEGEHRVVSPVSLIVSSFAPVEDVRGIRTPYFDIESEPLEILLIDISGGRRRLGGSIYSQVCQTFGESACPDLDDAEFFLRSLNTLIALHHTGSIVAYHDISDGGFFATLAEFCIASRCGVSVDLDSIDGERENLLFAEELGVCLVVRKSEREKVQKIIDGGGIAEHAHFIGVPQVESCVKVTFRGNIILNEPLSSLIVSWSKVSHEIQKRRDNPECALEELAQWQVTERKGLVAQLTFNPEDDVTLGCRVSSSKPKIAILREQGVNGHVEMAASFTLAGFDAIDVHMSDIHSGRIALGAFHGIVACGGFSYGDVLGAGSGWAHSILFSSRARDQFEQFFNRNDTFALGVCNGCQMLSQLKDMIPGAKLWPRFRRNKSEQFEARLLTVQVTESPSLFFSGMGESLLPIPVAHGEGRVEGDVAELLSSNLISLKYVDQEGFPTEKYPFNPNGSPGGITSVTTSDGRFTILMPHPERAFRALQLSCNPKGTFVEAGPWLRMFRNARKWVG